MLVQSVSRVGGLASVVCAMDVKIKRDGKTAEEEEEKEVCDAIAILDQDIVIPMDQEMGKAHRILRLISDANYCSV